MTSVEASNAYERGKRESCCCRSYKIGVSPCQCGCHEQSAAYNTAYQEGWNEGYEQARKDLTEQIRRDIQNENAEEKELNEKTLMEIGNVMRRIRKGHAKTYKS